MRSNEGKKEEKLRHNEQLRAIQASSQPKRSKIIRTERECPYCAEKILVKAKFCKHCKKDLEASEIKKETYAMQELLSKSDSEKPNTKRSFTYIEPYPFSFVYQGITVIHNNKVFVVEKHEFSSADDAKMYIDNIKT